MRRFPPPPRNAWRQRQLLLSGLQRSFENQCSQRRGSSGLSGGHRGSSVQTNGATSILSFLDREIGVHIVGEGATELIHIGQAVLAHKGKLDFFVDAVFSYPTLVEAYKIAALDAWNKL